MKLKNLLYFIAAAAIILLVMPRGAKFNYEYSRGSVWNYPTLFAQFDFPILKTEEQIIRETSDANSEVPYYRFSEGVVENTISSLRGLDLGECAAFVQESVQRIYERGVVSDASLPSEDDRNAVVYIQKGKRADRYPAKELLGLSDARAALSAMVSEHFPESNVDSLFSEKGILFLLVPNLIYDSQAAALVRSGVGISPTDGYVQAGELIVSKGEMITSEIAQILDSYRKEYDATMGFEGSEWSRLAGNLLIIMAMMALLAISVYFTNKGIFADNRFVYLLTIVVITSVAILSVLRFNEKAVMLCPFTLSALYLQAFFKNKVILPVYFISLMPLLIYAPSGFALYTMFLLAGVVAILSFVHFNKGWQQFVTAFITFAVLVVARCAFHLSGLMRGDLAQDISYLFLASFLTVAGYPLIYLFEMMFNLVSSSRLIELSDTSNKLLRDLEHKAPGTFQHSLQVMNMATSAARSIGASELMVRAGALYHDIGKMTNPLCFVENESLIAREGDAGYHSSRTPVQSAGDIIKHVLDGEQIARHHHIPSQIIDFILSHHGTSRVTFFYDKYLKEGGDPAMEWKFVYPGKKPRTREQTILMLCDSIEAGARTLKEKSPKAYSEFVDRIFDLKTDEGQLDESEISVSELGILRNDIKTYLGQVYHERVEYPSRKLERNILFKRYENRKQKN